MKLFSPLLFSQDMAILRQRQIDRWDNYSRIPSDFEINEIVNIENLEILDKRVYTILRGDNSIFYSYMVSLLLHVASNNCIAVTLPNIINPTDDDAPSPL